MINWIGAEGLHYGEEGFNPVTGYFDLTTVECFQGLSAEERLEDLLSYYADFWVIYPITSKGGIQLAQRNINTIWTPKELRSLRPAVLTYRDAGLGRSVSRYLLRADIPPDAVNYRFHPKDTLLREDFYRGF